MREVDTNTFFTNTKSITLDSIYFQAGSRVQCAARAFNANGDAGLELVSSIVVISKEEGKKKPPEIYRQNTGCRIIWFSWPYLLQVCVSLVSRVLLELNLSLQRFATRVQMIQTFPTSSNWQSTCLTWMVSGKFCCKSQYMPLYSQCVWQKNPKTIFCPFIRNAASDLHKTSVQLWAYPEPGWHTCGQPSLLQFAGLQWDPNWLRLHHRRNKEPWNNWGDIALSIQRCHAFSQLSALLQESQLRGLPLGVHQLLWHVRAAERLWRIHRNRWTGRKKS